MLTPPRLVPMSILEVLRDLLPKVDLRGHDRGGIHQRVLLELLENIQAGRRLPTVLIRGWQCVEGLGTLLALRELLPQPQQAQPQQQVLCCDLRDGMVGAIVPWEVKRWHLPLCGGSVTSTMQYLLFLKDLRVPDRECDRECLDKDLVLKCADAEVATADGWVKRIRDYPVAVWWVQ